MKKLFTLLNVAAMLCIAHFAIAQRNVTGKVTSAAEGALIGANVIAKGTKSVAVTDTEGNYSLSVPEGAKAIVISYTGYATQEITLGESSTINVLLAEDGQLNTVNVIGRNTTRTKLSSPVPVDVIPVKNIVNEVGQLDLNAILTYVAPSFQSSRQAIADGTDHVDPASLRGMGNDQVLVLVNGKRRHQSALVNVNGTVNRGQVGTDLSAIPASSVERIEILRDGAAAQYGSDAIAGIINVVLKTQTGLTANVSGGANVTEYAKNRAINFQNSMPNADHNVKVTDGQNIQAGLNYGLNVGKGHLNVGLEYLDRGATNRTGTYTAQIYPSVNGKVKDDSILTAKGLTRNDFDMQIGSSDVKGYGAVATFSMPVSSAVEVYANAGYNSKTGLSAGFFRYPNAIWTAGPGTNTNWTGVRAKVLNNYPDGFLPQIGTNVTDLSLGGGAKGVVKDWNYDLSVNHGRNDFAFNVANSINYSQVAVSPDAPVQTKFDAGKSVVTMTVANLDVSHKYKNIFQGLNSAYGFETRIDGYEIVAGEEASYKNYDTKFGVAAGSQVFQGFLKSNEGKNTRNSIAAYADYELDFTDKFMIGLAGRGEKYSDFGSTWNWKATTRYHITDFVTLRGAYSTGFRAPSMAQKFYSKTNTIFIAVNGVQTPVESGTFTNNSAIAGLLGIPTLKQETSQNYSAGFTARLSDYMEWTTDIYQIDVNDRIILTNNFSGGSNAALGAALTAAGASTANVFTNAVDTRARGLESVLSWRRTFGKSTLGIVGAVTFINNKVIKEYEALGNGSQKPYVKASDVLVRSGQIGNYFNREDQSRLEVAMPRTKASVTMNYKRGPIGVMVRNAYFGQVQYLDPTVNPADTVSTFPSDRFSFGTRRTLDQTFTPKLITDLTLSYTIQKRYTISIGANNLFDVYPDEHNHWNNLSTGRFVYSRRVQQMGFNGRYVFARVNVALTK